MSDERSLYDTDFLTWTEEQAAALRELAARRDLPNTLDLENVIEEIETLGRSELKAATIPIRLTLEHLLKLAFDPDSDAQRHWRAEITTWHADVLEELLPSMQRKIELDRLWQYAVRRARGPLQERDRSLPEWLPTTCPLGLRDFLAPVFDVDAALARIRAPTGGA
ncbi:MAG: DUF29 domain-containing protein [Acetobacteraceae bacterium]|nr:DUF29 domain-containing protein [Acetobacteraceae bacterium]